MLLDKEDVIGRLNHALMADEPPSRLPLGTWSRRPPRSSSGSVTKSQRWSVLKTCVNTAGMEASRRKARCPGLEQGTRDVGWCSAAWQHAATEPAPTTAKSVEVDYVPTAC